MPILPENPCADGHPELKLMLEVTSFSDRLPVMHCNRCGQNLGFEEAVRNDERLRIVKGIQELDTSLADLGGLAAKMSSFVTSQAVLIARGYGSERSDG